MPPRVAPAPFNSPDQGKRGDLHKKYQDRWATFESRWGSYCKLLQKQLETWYRQNQPDQNKSSKSKLSKQE